ncbi:Nramp family divalent metal transporter [Sphingomonas morindae]|uniref:Divalent metal cation transporter MntH n=1 Tax=Sphingomonas morindae TaxID=1541170 RepID=A0ABY4XA76_9SPHN|nr:Nramp family divalent metal transporter [Sphingomonas morindae]USI73773.1 Nramp family divalent metal transporter [Sphingomonas morindae]
MFTLPKTATAPFCPPEVQGSVRVPEGAPTLGRLLRFLGPGLLVSVGYMDPGNWATDIEAGSRFGYGLLCVVLGCGLAAMLLQSLSVRLGLVTGRDLAQMARAHYPRGVTRGLWLLAELAIIATDIAEVLGSALAITLLFGLPLWLGVLLTALDTVLVLGLKGHGFRELEAIVLGLIATIAGCFVAQIALAPPAPAAVLAGLLPSAGLFSDPHAVYLAVGILGATVMPHNLYLHSAIVQTRGAASIGFGDRLRYARIDTIAALALATLVNMAILIVAATVFHGSGHEAVAEIGDAFHLLEPLTGAAVAPILFGVALLASGQSATFTGTIAGQVVLEGFLDLRIPCWQRRLITRGLALGPALAGVLAFGDGGVGKLLVLTQVVLSLQLPFALAPLIGFTANPAIMGRFRLARPVAGIAWALFAGIVLADLWLLAALLGIAG